VRDAEGAHDARMACTSTFEPHRPELTRHCSRILGSTFEAEDAVQETIVRAWRGYDRFEGRAALRTWLYRIATNVCVDMLESRRRRPLPMDFGQESRDDGAATQRLPEHLWRQPSRDGHAVRPSDDPAELTASRETIRIAFIATLQHLPPRQRAVLFLREVLRWRAIEVAELLGTSVASVNSALQRARATLSATNLTPANPLHPEDKTQQALLNRYMDAFERFDIELLVSLLYEDATAPIPRHNSTASVNLLASRARRGRTPWQRLTRAQCGDADRPSGKDTPWPEYDDTRLVRRAD
jgi:RNA polymerase sigma-70 factor (ECF subfamily)